MINRGYGVVLNVIDSTDCETIRAFRNDYRIWKWSRQNSLISDVQQQRWFDNLSKDKTMRMFFIEDLERDKIGVCGLSSIDLENAKAEFSIYIAPDLHKKGYGKRGLKTLLDYSFNALPLQSIWGETFDGNPALKLFKAVGMKHEGTRRACYFRDGKFIDSHLISILREEWEKKV